MARREPVTQTLCEWSASLPGSRAVALISYPQPARARTVVARRATSRLMFYVRSCYWAEAQIK
ncbi:hypothetical protein COT77_01220 [Candidatus Berkelbacteria bacterium CG10_big_fil_rev_8_21_14_0_10_41_12]|uniref:Uncharacterized protein n=1 Tax=Candidatus Berkelbacteria bacterium CG10_big_fil_rev_8_21_14_0_10_41_12 TaxID=1974513 RepID=A0A2M6WXK6_9BACT|nr:MAG: hypothetical protein COT77_01220 [Candidatus Berkelbacteria bacterium CG10_big_fil_rev_8_21_14_0_10_41_12]